MELKKVLVIRFSSIGDILLTTPVVAAFKEQCQADVHFITKTKYAGLLRANPRIDKLHLIDKDIDNKTIQILKGEKFDLVVDLHKNLRTLRLKRALKAPSVSFDKVNWEKWLVVRTKTSKYLPDKHLVDRYFESLKSYGIKKPSTGLEYYFQKSDPELVDELESVSKESGILSFPKEESYLAIALAAAHRTKAIPAQLIISIIKKINLPVILLGGTDYKEEAKQISSVIPNIISLVGLTSLDLTAYLIREASLVLTPDTGLMHLSAALGKKTIAVWGNTIPEFGMYPYFPEKNEVSRYINFQVAGLKCRPCSKLGYNKCPKGHFKCMNDQNVDAIVQQIELFHKNEPPSHY